MAVAQRYNLRLFKDDDKKLVYDWRNSEKIRANMYNSQVIAWEDHCQWFGKVLDNQRGVYRIFEAGGLPAGLVNFTNIDIANNSCFWGFYIGASGLPKGTGLVMGFLALELAFSELSIRKVCGECLAFNIASAKYHERLGFLREGYFIEHILRDGKYEDIIRFAIFNREWAEKRRNIEQVIYSYGISGPSF